MRFIIHPPSINNGTKGLWIETSGSTGMAPDVYLDNVHASGNGLKGA